MVTHMYPRFMHSGAIARMLPKQNKPHDPQFWEIADSGACTCMCILVEYIWHTPSAIWDIYYIDLYIRRTFGASPLSSTGIQVTLLLSDAAKESQTKLGDNHRGIDEFFRFCSSSQSILQFVVQAQFIPHQVCRRCVAGDECGVRQLELMSEQTGSNVTRNEMISKKESLAIQYVTLGRIWQRRGKSLLLGKATLTQTIYLLRSLVCPCLLVFALCFARSHLLSRVPTPHPIFFYIAFSPENCMHRKQIHSLCHSKESCFLHVSPASRS